MTKLISFFVFTAAFIWTWFLLFNSSSTINQATHAGLQSKLTLLIAQSIKNARPNSSNFEILNIQSEKIDENQIRALFTYKYTDQLLDNDSSIQTLSGEALLYRSLSENPANEKWIAKSIKMSDSAIEFQQGLVVSAEPEAAAIQASTDSSTSSPSNSSPEETKTQ